MFKSIFLPQTLHDLRQPVLHDDILTHWQPQRHADMVHHQINNRFPGDVKYFFSPESLMDWLAQSSPVDANRVLAASAWSVAALDKHFLTSFMPDDEPAKYDDYCSTRMKQIIVAEGFLSLVLKAVLNHVPDFWTPDALLMKSVSEEIQKHLEFDSFSVEIELSDRDRIETPLSRKGGVTLLKQHSMKEWNRILNCIKDGAPCLVEVFRANIESDPREMELVLVTAVNDHTSNRKSFCIANPESRDTDSWIEFKFTEQSLSSAESSADRRNPIKGFRMINVATSQE